MALRTAADSPFNIQTLRLQGTAQARLWLFHSEFARVILVQGNSVIGIRLPTAQR